MIKITLFEEDEYEDEDAIKTHCDTYMKVQVRKNSNVIDEILKRKIY